MFRHPLLFQSKAQGSYCNNHAWLKGHFNYASPRLQTCPSTSHCLHYSGLVDGARQISSGHSCDMESRLRWINQGNTLQTLKLYHKSNIYKGNPRGLSYCQTHGNGCHDFGDAYVEGVKIRDVEICCCDQNL